MKEILCDVLVIGAGAAGIRAAYEAKKAAPELDVVLTCNGRLHSSGSTNLNASEALGINAPFNYMNDGDDADTYYEDIISTGDGLASPELSRIVANESCARLTELMELGVKFDMQQGRPLQKKLSCCTKARSLVCGGGTGIQIVKALSKACLEKGVKVTEKVRMLSLSQTADKRVCGAFGLVDGKPAHFHAKAVILASGGAGRIFARNVNPPDIAGDGWAMAAQVGAKLVNLEFFQVGPAVVKPEMTFIIHSHMWRLMPKLTNFMGQEFLSKYCPAGVKPEEVLEAKVMAYPFSIRTSSMYLDIAVFKEILSGRGTPNGGVYFDVTHIGLDEFMGKSPLTYQRFKKAGVDLRTDKIELGMAVQNFNGGILIDRNGYTGVEGLYAAGEVTGGVHGSDRPGGDNLTDTQIFGYRAGVSAAKEAQRMANEKISGGVPADFGRIEMNDKDRAILEESMQLFFRELTVIRNAQGLSHVLAFTDRYLQEDVCVGVKNQLLIGKLLAQAMLVREESRGTHYREDFPKTKADWTNWIVMKLDENRQITLDIQKVR